MDTFQSLVTAAVHGLTQFFPISESDHRILLPYFLNWPEPSVPLKGALALGSSLAAFVYFRHDWASIIASGLRVLFLWKKPMALDERLPIFLLFSTVPPIAASVYCVHTSWASTFETPLWASLGLVAGGLLLYLGEHLNRSNKTMSYWNWKDSLIFGLMQCGYLLPGIGRVTAGIFSAFLLNYNREAAVKYVSYSLVPTLTMEAFIRLKDVHIKSPSPGGDLSWMSFWCGMGLSFFVGLFALTAILQSKNLRGFAIYRFILAGAGLTVIWLH